MRLLPLFTILSRVRASSQFYHVLVVIELTTFRFVRAGEVSRLAALLNFQVAPSLLNKKDVGYPPTQGINKQYI